MFDPSFKKNNWPETGSGAQTFIFLSHSSGLCVQRLYSSLQMIQCAAIHWTFYNSWCSDPEFYQHQFLQLSWNECCNLKQSFVPLSSVDSILEWWVLSGQRGFLYRVKVITLSIVAYCLQLPLAQLVCEDKILSPSCRSHSKFLLLWSNKFTAVMLRLATLAAASEMRCLKHFDYIFYLKAMVGAANPKVSFANAYSAN